MPSTETFARVGLIAAVSVVIGLNTLRPLLKQAGAPDAPLVLASPPPTAPVVPPAITAQEPDVILPPMNVSTSNLTVDEPARAALQSEPPLMDETLGAAPPAAAPPPAAQAAPAAAKAEGREDLET